MFKKIMASVLALTLVFGSGVLTAVNVLPDTAVTAIAETYGDFEYTVLDDGTVEISKYTGKDTAPAIPSQIDGMSVTSIGYSAFLECESLTSITIPDSVTSINERAFFLCTSLTNIFVDSNNTMYSSENGVLFDKEKTTLLLCPAKKENLVIYDTVTSIGSHALDNITNLTEIFVYSENSMYSSQDGVLFDKEKTTLIVCPAKKKDIVIPDSVTSIGDNAFYKCESLTSITIPDSVTSIGEWAFDACTSLTDITIPDGVTSISDHAFASCTSLTDITIPNSVTSIDKSAFASCTSLTDITIPNSVTSIGSDAFNSCTSLTNITIPDSVKIIENTAFLGCENLTKLTIPDSVTSIGKWAYGYYWVGLSIEKYNNFKLYCKKGSAAEQYAIDNEFYYIGEVGGMQVYSTTEPNPDDTSSELDESSSEADDTSSKADESSSKTDDSSSKPDADSSTEPDPKPEILHGNINGDDKIDISDVTTLINHVNGVKALSSEQMKYADVDGDGNVDIKDVAAIINHINGLKSLY